MIKNNTKPRTLKVPVPSLTAGIQVCVLHDKKQHKAAHVKGVSPVTDGWDEFQVCVLHDKKTTQSRAR